MTDHGDLHTVEYVTTPMPPSNSVVAANVAAFVAADFEELQFERPGFSITINLAPFTHEVGDNPDDYVSYFPTNAWRLLLTPPPPAEPLLLTAFDERFIEWEDGIVGNVPNEGLRLFFPVEPTLFIDSFFDVMYDVEIFNDTATNYQVMAFSQDTGPVAKGESEPDFFLIVEDTLIGENDMTYDGQEIVVNGCVATIDGVHVFDRLTLTNDAIVTHTSGSMGLALTVLEDLTLQTGSQIDASGRGSGPKPETTGRSGGSYGGLGEGALGDSCPTYGDSWRPVDSGSGGIGPDAITYGGGCVRLVANYLTLDGTICVDGQDGPLYTGGGSGGAIWIDVNGLSGSGLLQANGGTAGADGGAGGGGRIAVYAQNTEGFVPTAVEAKANSGAGWGSVFLGMPLSVACAVSGLGTCDPAEPVVIPYQGTNLFTFSSMPLSLATNGVSLSPSAMFEWVNAGLSRGTLDDAAWSALLTESSLLEAGFAALELAGVTPSFGSGVELPVNGLAGWSYTLQRRTSLTEGEWELVAGQTDILCSEDGVLVLSDTEMLPQAFYRVLATP
ncbi:MAG: hypothetical protein PF904_16345 [Kiritimatiellae bacterium]|nr:hypothetical protein [Kiritimatiellia bacterium]